MKSGSFYIVSMILGAAVLLSVFIDPKGAEADSLSTSPVATVGPRAAFEHPRLFEPLTDSKGKALNMLLDQSHNTYEMYDADFYFSSLITLAQSLGFTVTIASDFAGLMSYDVVLLNLPQMSYSTSEVSLIRDYLNAGKILWLFGEWGPSAGWSNTYINALLSQLDAGVQIVDGEVSEPVEAWGGFDTAAIIGTFSDHCLVEGLTKIVHPRSGYLLADNPDSYLYFSTDQAVDNYDLQADPPFPMGAIPNPTTHPNWRLFLTADTNLFWTDSSYDWFAIEENPLFAEKLLFWCGCEIDAECDDGLWCNGAETCDVESGTCLEGEPLCVEDGYWCNGEVTCDEEADECVYGDPPCSDDGLWCNGDEGCDEEDDACTHSGEPCFDDGLFCNGEESCVENSDECTHTGDPCEATQTCDEETDECRDAVVPPDDDVHADDTDELVTDDESDPGWPEGNVTGGCCGD